MTSIQPVLLGGGAGTRLWPLSREQHPKQLQVLSGERSLIQATALRLDGYDGPEAVAAPIVVCNEEHRFVIAEQLRQVDRACRAIVLEPAGRNTAPALTLGALVAQAAAEADPLLLVMPTDHLVRDPAAFRRAVAQAAARAAAGDIVTFGVEPERAETEYGYLRLGTPLDAGTAFQLDCFVEKPDADTARQYAEDGRYLWNAGVFLLRASTWLAAVERHAPAMHAACAAAVRDGTREGPFVRVDPEAFGASPANSIDYAVMEPLVADPESPFRACVVPLDAGWSDVGAWDALWRVSEKDAAGNATRGDVLLEDVDNSLVLAGDHLVVCLGMRDVVVIDTPDAVLVAPRERAREVRRVVARLLDGKRSEARAHRKIHRPWGYYDSIHQGERFQVKRIVVSPKAALSLQMHHHRAEHWIVVRGTAEVTRGEERFLVSENESAFIPLGVRHRIENPGLLPLEMIEVQSGPYLGEDDIVRFGDSYGRS